MLPKQQMWQQGLLSWQQNKNSMLLTKCCNNLLHSWKWGLLFHFVHNATDNEEQQSSVFLPVFQLHWTSKHMSDSTEHCDGGTNRLVTGNLGLKFDQPTVWRSTWKEVKSFCNTTRNHRPQSNHKNSQSRFRKKTEFKFWNEEKLTAGFSIPFLHKPTKIKPNVFKVSNAWIQLIRN